MRCIDGKQTGRIDDIESLRAIAVLFTLFSHVGTLLIWGNPVVLAVVPFLRFWSGVDLFLCISGFVIAREMLPKLQRTSNSTEFWCLSIAFWIKRIFRIWPTAWLWAGVIFASSIALRKTGILPPVIDVFREMISIAVQTENIHAWRCAVQVGDPSCVAAGPWWSLALEEQFYIALPVIIFFFRKKIGMVMGLSILLIAFLPRPSAGFLWHVRTDSIALGVLLAMFSRHPLYTVMEPTFLRRRFYAVPVIVTLLTLLAALAAFSDQPASAIPFALGIIAVVSAIIVFIASYDQDYIARGKITKRVLLWIGSRSFAIYLTHWPAIWFTRAIWRYVEPAGTVFNGTYTLRFLFTWLAITAVCAELNFQHVEKPMRRRGRAIAARIEARLLPEQHDASETPGSRQSTP